MATLSDDTAFPIQNIGDDYTTGLTKREYFAAMALQGLLATNSVYSGEFENYVQQTAQASVCYANALIVALNESQHLAGLPEN